MEKSLRICLHSREYLPDTTGFGGMATFANHLGHGLVTLGHQVHMGFNKLRPRPRIFVSKMLLGQ